MEQYATIWCHKQILLRVNPHVKRILADVLASLLKSNLYGQSARLYDGTTVAESGRDLDIAENRNMPDTRVRCYGL